MCVLVCVQGDAHAGVCAHVWGQEGNHGVSLYPLSTFFFTDRSSMGLELIEQAGWPGSCRVSRGINNAFPDFVFGVACGVPYRVNVFDPKFAVRKKRWEGEGERF